MPSANFTVSIQSDPVEILIAFDGSRPKYPRFANTPVRIEYELHDNLVHLMIFHRLFRIYLPGEAQHCGGSPERPHRATTQA